MYYWAHSQSIITPSPGKLTTVNWPPNKGHTEPSNLSHDLQNEMKDKSEDELSDVCIPKEVEASNDSTTIPHSNNGELLML